MKDTVKHLQNIYEGVPSGQKHGCHRNGSFMCGAQRNPLTPYAMIQQGSDSELRRICKGEMYTVGCPGAKNGGRAFPYAPSVSLAFLIPSAAPSMMISSFSSIPFSIRSMCFRRSLAAQLVRVEKFIHGNIQKGDEFVKGVEAGVLAPVLNIHDGARGEVYKLGQMLLRPAFGFRLRLISWPRAWQSRRFSYWYIFTSPLYYFTFRGGI